MKLGTWPGLKGYIELFVRENDENNIYIYICMFVYV